MADIRINALATTAASTASDDFVAVDGSANGTRKLNAYSPTFGGNVVATGTLTVNSTTDSSSKDTGAIITEGGLGVEKSATIGGNLTVSGTAINLSTNNSTDKVVSIGYSTVPLYLTSSYDGSTFGLSGFSANSRPSGSSYTTPSNTSYGNLYFLAKIAASDTASAFEWKHAPRTAGTPVTTSLMTLNGSGNLLIGTTTDGGQKLQVSGSGFITGSLAVGDRAAPAGVSLRVQQAGSDDVGLEWQRTSATNGILLSYNRASSAYTSLSYGASSHTFTISGTTALTLDSSQNAEFTKKFGNSGTTSISGDVACSVVNVSATGYGLRVQGGVVAGGYVLSALDYAGTERLRLEGNGEMYVRNVGSAPASTPSSGGFLYIEAGALKYKGSSGTITPIAPA